MWVRQEWQTEMKTQCLRLYSDVIKRDRVHALFYFCSETLISISLAGSVQFWLFCKCNMRLSKFTRRSSDFMFSELTTALVFPLDQKRDLWLDVYLLEIESIQTSCLKEPIKFLVWCNHTDMGYPSLARVENPPTASNVLLVSVHSRKLDPPVMSTNIHFGFFFFFWRFCFLPYFYEGKNGHIVNTILFLKNRLFLFSFSPVTLIWIRNIFFLLWMGQASWLWMCFPWPL